MSGTEGVVAVPFAATNQARQRIACTASIAHWYSLDLGEAGHGEAVEATLWFDPKSGEISILNAVGDRMPITALWCGLAGKSWTTRSPVALSRRAGEMPGRIELTCVRRRERLACQ